MRHLEDVVDRFQRDGIKGELWIDGSFLTEKIDPEDSDAVLSIPATLYDNGTPKQKETIEWFNDNLKAAYGMSCDSYVHFAYHEGHPLYWEGEFMRAYWMAKWGFGWGEDFTGIAVLEL